MNVYYLNKMWIEQKFLIYLDSERTGKSVIHTDDLYLRSLYSMKNTVKMVTTMIIIDVIGIKGYTGTLILYVSGAIGQVLHTLFLAQPQRTQQLE